VITKRKITDSYKAIEQAEQALRAAKEAHREAFRQALVALFNEYGLCLEANGTEGARLEIEELGAPLYHANRLPE
jgi:hypothetical protein